MTDWRTERGEEFVAATTWAALDILDLTSLSRCGGGYPKPGEERIPYFRGRIGRPFMSWVLPIWALAGYINVSIEADLEPDHQLAALGWLERATPDRRWLLLRRDDVLSLLSDQSLWGPGNVIGRMHLVMTVEGKKLPAETWIQSARDWPAPPPALGEDRKLSELPDQAREFFEPKYQGERPPPGYYFSL